MSAHPTPRTDAAFDAHSGYGVLKEFARQLERELARAVAQVDQLKKNNRTPTWAPGTATGKVIEI